MAVPLMSNSTFLKVNLAILLLWVPALAQTPTKKDTTSPDFSKEGVVTERLETKIVFQADGSYTREQKSRIRIQSEAGVQQYAVLRPPYQTSLERIEVLDVRVTKPNGSIVISPLDSIQDAPSQIYPGAAEFADLHEKHIPVKGLEPGDILEYSIRWQVETPIVAGQFWCRYSFLKSAIVLDEQLEISIPSDREVKVKSRSVRPTIGEENGRRIYVWKTSNLEHQDIEKERETHSYDTIRGQLAGPDVLISSFRTWEEVGRWYEGLQKEKIQPSADIKAKAEELTKGLRDDDAKLRAIYNYVSLHYHYVGIAFGVGHYQPHSASEILANQYGDCKDKHTLLAALLGAVGIRAYPALISSWAMVDQDVPMPGQFDHVISVVRQRSTLSWMDTTPEVTAMGYLATHLRGKPALVIMPDKVEFQNTPSDSPFPNKYTNAVTAKLDADGTLQAHVEATYRGDDSEVSYRYLFRRIPEPQWKDYAQKNFYGARLGGTVTSVGASSPEKTDEPLTVTYEYTLRDFFGGDRHRFAIPLSPLAIPEVKDADLNRTTPLWLGEVGEQLYESRIELPRGWSASQPMPLDLKESFAEFHGDTEVNGNVLVTKRRLLLKLNAITPDQLTSYKNFQKAISDDHALYIFLQVPPNVPASGLVSTPSQGLARVGELARQSVIQLPGSSNTEALQSEQDAWKSMRAQDYSSAITDLKRAVSLDPTFSRAWIELGVTYYSGVRDMNLSLNAFQKAIEADPKQIVPYKILAFMYIGIGKRDDAMATWKKLQSIAPDDPDLALNFSASKSKEVSQVGNKGTSFTTLVSSANPSAFGQAVTFTATVTPLLIGTPTGAVTFKNGPETLGTVTLSDGVATYTTTKLAVGTEPITAVYNGSGSFLASTSSPLSQVVNPASTTATPQRPSPAVTPAEGPGRTAALLRQSLSQLPGSSNLEALQAEENARKSMRTKDYTSAITALKYAVSLDANFSRAWIELGWVYASNADKNSALSAFQKAIEGDPKQVVPYKIVALMYRDLADLDDAIDTWQKVRSLDPGDPDLALYLGGLYLEQKRYSEAAPLLESAAKANPTDAYAQLRVGIVRLNTHNADQGLEALHKALEIDSGAEMLNNVAYQMAESDTNLSDALGYSQRSIKELEERSQKVDLENIQKEDRQLTLKISLCWDTLGWIYFKMGDLPGAEIYLTAAWQLGEDGVVGDHLGQVYEKERKQPAAIHMYSLALEANPRLDETPARLRKLAALPLSAKGMSAAEELKSMRTIKLPTIIKETASADFDIEMVASGKIEKANFSGGSELLHQAAESLEKAQFGQVFPPNSTAQLLRRGTLSCSDTGCNFVFYPLSAAAGAN